MTEKESLTGSKPFNLSVVVEKSTDKEEWAYVGTSKGQQTSPIKKAESCRSPNGFQVLQDLREEGEIDGEDEDIVEENLENVVTKEDIAKVVEVDDGGGADEDGLVVKDLQSADASADLTGDTKVSIQRQRSSSRGRGRGSKKHIVNSRDLVQVITQQNKVNQTSKKASSRKH